MSIYIDTIYRMEQWMRALTCAGYEYMKLMVAELQRQLNEIERSKGIKIMFCCYWFISIYSKMCQFSDKANNSVESAPQPPPRRQNPRQNPFNRPAPPPPIYTVPNPNGKYKKRTLSLNFRIFHFSSLKKRLKEKCIYLMLTSLFFFL